MHFVIPVRVKQVSVALGMLCASAGLAWASCGETAILVATQANTDAASLVSSIESGVASIVAKDRTETDRLMSAIAVATKQVQASTDAMAAATVQATQAQAQTMSDIASSELKSKFQEDFVESNGGLPCDDTVKTQNMAAVERTVQSSIGTRIRSEVQSVGKYAHLGTVMTQRQQEHEALFCTQTEVDAGACKTLGAVPGGDQNASLLFSADTSPATVKAKNAFINNVLGTPDAPINSATAQTPEADAYVQAKKQKDAFLSFAAVSFKSIQADSEQFDPVMNERVGQYFGTAAAEQWANNQAGQATRGVLVDLVKMQGINLKIAERRLRQSLRMEANLAAMVELERKAQFDGEVAIAANLARKAAGVKRAQQ